MRFRGLFQARVRRTEAPQNSKAMHRKLMKIYDFSNTGELRMRENMDQKKLCILTLFTQWCQYLNIELVFHPKITWSKNITTYSCKKAIIDIKRLYSPSLVTT